MDISFIFQIAILVLSVVIHEVSHGYAALLQGDVTAKYAGRLTLNPIRHIDPLGSIIVPAMLAILPGGIIFGWAKPVPYNPYNLRNKRWGELLVAAAGPASNIMVAAVFSLIIRFADVLNLSQSFYQLTFFVVVINLVLAIFNLMPIAPLDGSKIWFSLWPKYTLKIRLFLEKYSVFFVLIFIFFFWRLMLPILEWAVWLFTGISF